MGCFGNRELDLVALKEYYGFALSYADQAGDWRSQAKTHWDVNEDHEAIYDIICAIDKLEVCVGNLTGRYESFYPEYGILHFLETHTAENGAVDMDSILTAMITADFDQLQKFVGLVDAYRVAVWNAPFNADFYAALARGFQKWP